MSYPNTVLLKGDGIQKEANAGGTIKPGHLIMRNSSDAVVVHGTAGGDNAGMFALENEDFGYDLNSSYSSGDRVRFIFPDEGSEIYAWLPASAAAVVIGDMLCSNGDGTLKKYVAQATNEGGTGTYTIQTEGVVAVALEAVNNSGGGTPVRIKVEVI